jgi:hypothetical protein
LNAVVPLEKVRQGSNLAHSPSDVRCPILSLREDTAPREPFCLAPTVCVPADPLLYLNAAFAIWFRSSRRPARFPIPTQREPGPLRLDELRQLLPEPLSGVGHDGAVAFMLLLGTTGHQSQPQSMTLSRIPGIIAARRSDEHRTITGVPLRDGQKKTTRTLSAKTKEKCEYKERQLRWERFGREKCREAHRVTRRVTSHQSPMTRHREEVI